MKYFLIEIVLYIRRVLIVGEISIYFLRQKYYQNINALYFKIIWLFNISDFKVIPETCHAH